MAPQVHSASFRPSVRFLCACLQQPPLQGWIVRSQVWVHNDSARFCQILPWFQEWNVHQGRAKREQQDFAHKIRIYFFMLEIPFLSFGKNSNWVKYRKFTTSPFYLLLHLCTGFINDDSRNWLGFGALVSHLMWGSSWENIHTCHSWALIQGTCYWTSPYLPGKRLPWKLIIGPLEKMLSNFFKVTQESYFNNVCCIYFL